VARPWSALLQYNARGFLRRERLGCARDRLSAAEFFSRPGTGPAGRCRRDGEPGSACVVWKLSRSKYASFFETVWGAGALSGVRFPSDAAHLCSIPKGSVEPPARLLPLSPSDRTRANQAFNEFGQAIAAYEIASAISPFTSKFDAYLAGKATLTAAEREATICSAAKPTAIPVTSTAARMPKSLAKSTTAQRPM
jgi:hypothetical protein